jgi:hypothetical protein
MSEFEVKRILIFHLLHSPFSAGLELPINGALQLGYVIWLRCSPEGVVGRTKLVEIENTHLVACT